VKPVLIVIAGPNGAGKTTVTERIRRDHWSDGVTYLNPDEIARDRFGDWNNPEHSLKAAVWVAEERERLLDAGQSLAFETVLSMPDKLDFIARARGIPQRSWRSDSPSLAHSSFAMTTSSALATNTDTPP
jgi:predicted ABC-type ATPase